MAHQQKLAEELKQLEEGIYGKPTPQEPATVAPEPVVEEPEVEPTVVEVAPEPVTAEPTPKPTVAEPEVTDWEKRFKNYKASSDATTYQLRQERIALQEQMNAQAEIMQKLQKELAEFKANKTDVYEGLYTDEEKDLIGEETLNALKKAQEAGLKAKLEPMQQQLENERKLREEMKAKQLEAEKLALHNEFMEKLAVAVPDYQTIDTDTAFHAWMKEPDPISGHPREVLFHRAQANGDVARVAGFFNEFKEVTKPTKVIEGKVTPTTTGKAPVPPTKQVEPVITEQFIEAFYDAVHKGKFKGREKEQQDIVRRIDDHFRKISAR